MDKTYKLINTIEIIIKNNKIIKESIIKTIIVHMEEEINEDSDSSDDFINGFKSDFSSEEIEEYIEKHIAITELTYGDEEDSENEMIEY